MKLKISERIKGAMNPPDGQTSFEAKDLAARPLIVACVLGFRQMLILANQTR